MIKGARMDKHATRFFLLMAMALWTSPAWAAPRWGKTPVKVATGLPVVKDSERFSRAIADGHGGTFLAWVAVDPLEDTGMRLYGQHISAEGKKLWNGGESLRLAAAPKINYGNLGLASDGAGGIVVSYQEVGESAHTFGRLNLLRVDASGRSLWTTEVPKAFGAGKYFLVPGGDGGVIALASNENSSKAGETVFLFRADGKGKILYSRDVYATPSATTLLFANLGFAGEKPGEALFILADRHQGDSFQVFALHVDADGKVEDRRLSEDEWAGLNPELPCGRLIGASADGQGGAYVSWVGRKEGAEVLRLLRVDSHGNAAATWPKGGVVVDNDSKSFKFGLAATTDEQGGVLLQYVSRPHGPFEQEGTAPKNSSGASCDETHRYVTGTTPAQYTADLWLARFGPKNASPLFSARVARHLGQEQHEVVRSGEYIYSSWVEEPTRNVVAQVSDLTGRTRFGEGLVVGSYKGTGSLGITVMRGAGDTMVVAWKQSQHLYAQSISAAMIPTAPSEKR